MDEITPISERQKKKDPLFKRRVTSLGGTAVPGTVADIGIDGAGEKCYFIKYDDGDVEDLSASEVIAQLIDESQHKGRGRGRSGHHGNGKGTGGTRRRQTPSGAA